MTNIEIRRGGPDDVAAVLGMLDSAIAWMVEREATGQWGSTPASQTPRFVDRVNTFADSGGLHMAIMDGQPAGALSVGVPLNYAPPANEPELYVQLLITHRRYSGLGVGSRLLEHAAELARADNLGLLRVDCYAGNDGKLVEYYERQGFTRTESFTVDRPAGAWPGQFLERRLSPAVLPGRHPVATLNTVETGAQRTPGDENMAAQHREPA